MTPELPADIRDIAVWLAHTSGISTSIIGAQSLRRAIRLRQEATEHVDIPTYQTHLLSSPEEQQCLVELLVVPETWFFRDRYPFAHLREHVERLLEGAGLSQPLRLLSAPCASGEEPYSIAMTLLDMGLPQDAFRIDAIDICRTSIRKARGAVYGRHSFRGVSAEEQAKHFESRAEGQALHEEIRKAVHFKRANLMHCLSATASQYDVIFCRNLLIYLEESASQHLLETFAGLMAPGGLLIVGSAETAKVPTHLFTPIRASFVFGFLRREPSASPMPLALPPATSSERPAASPTPIAPTRSPRRSPSRTVRRPAVPATNGSRGAPSRSVLPNPPAPAPSGADQELQLCRLELERNPYSDGAYLRLAQWMRSHNRLEEAMECLQKCLYLKPDNREALRVLIQLSDQLGEPQRRRQFQERLARLES